MKNCWRSSINNFAVQLLFNIFEKVVTARKGFRVVELDSGEGTKIVADIVHVKKGQVFAEITILFKTHHRSLHWVGMHRRWCPGCTDTEPF